MSVFKFGTLKSPPRRPTVQGSEQSPFCTSPSQLQEVRLDPDSSANATIPFTLGLRSPGKTSPIRGRTMKEYEEQLTQLKKENFNLKLRIYFLDERMGQMNRMDDKEDHIKENIELKVEAESLRKEVSDKQELLCQAAKALDILEEQHRSELKKLKQQRDMEKGILESRIQELEKELNIFRDQVKEQKFLKLEGTADVHSQEETEQLRQQLADLTSQVQRLEESLEEETQHNSQLEADLQEIQQESERVAQRCEGLELELKQRDEKMEELVQELAQRGQELAESNLRIRTLEDSLSTKEPEIQIKVQELCERDRIIEEKQNQIEQQNKVLVEIQITLDEKQRQIDALRSSIAARDTTIAELESKLVKAKANIHNLEAKLNAANHESKRLREEVETIKLQQKRCRSNSSREHLPDDALSPLRRKSSSSQLGTADGRTSSPGARTRLSSEDDSKFRKRLSDVSLKVKTMEGSNKEESLRYEATQLQIKKLEVQNAETTNKLREAEELLKKQECHSKRIDEERIKAYQAIKGFMKRNKDLSRELEQLKLEVKKRDHHIHDLTSELNELRDACNKANWEACQLQAQAQVQGSCGIPGTFQDVRDMTEEENERLWAELEDKSKKLVEVTSQRDNLSAEMEKQVQNVLTALQDKESSLDECEKRYAASSGELEARNKQIQELNEELMQMRKKLEAIEKDLQEKNRAETEEKKENEEKQEKIQNLEVELEDRKKEVEHLNTELRKKNNNLQDLVNKELWDKNKEIERLRDGGEKKEMEVMLLQQKLNARDFQLQLLQEKVTELGIQVSLPTSLVLREMQQQQVGTYFAQHMHMAGDAEHSLRDQLQACWEERKYLCQKIDELREKLRNTPERDSDGRALRTECTRLREELEKADTWRKDATEVCSKLTQRLEELAMFLAALLKHPEQLNGLGLKRRLMLRQAVERSMEMSRSLSVSLSATNQDFNETTLPPLKDSISSIFMTSDLNISELLKDSCENLETTGVNNDKLASEKCVEEKNNTENVSAKNIISDSLSERFLEHAELVSNLQLQVEALQQEVKQGNREKEVLQQIADRTSLVSADSVQKSETEDNHSLSSMTFYNSSIVGNSYGAVVVNDDKVPGSNSVPVNVIELTDRLTASCQISRLETPKLSPPKKSTKATSGNKMRRSSSASAVTQTQVVPAVPNKEQCAGGSLSDSEAWSEPDRSVSLARIGLSEEGTNTVVSSGANNNMDVGSNCCRKLILVEDNSSDSEETTREIIRTPGKRVRNETAEIKRLQNRLRALEHLNEVLRAELSIMHQLTPRGNKSVLICHQNVSAVSVDKNASVIKSPTKDVGTNTNQTSISEIEVKESKDKVELQDKSMNTTGVMNKSSMDCSASIETPQKPVAVPIHLLEQIKFQREKLESSLHHNNLIKHHLEKVFVSLSSKQDDVASEACRRIKETAEQLEEARHKCLRQEHQLKELHLQLEQSVQEAKQANEQLQVTQNTVRSFQERIDHLEALLKERDSQISEKQCLLTESQNECKEKNLELEKMVREVSRLKEEFAKELQEAQRLKKESEAKFQEALKIQEDAKIKIAEMELELSDHKILVERQNLEKLELQKEKEENIKKFEMMLREVREQREDVEYQNREVRKKMQQAELQKLEAERLVKEIQQSAEKFKEECKSHAEKVIDKQRRDLEMQLQLKVCEEKQRLEDLYRKEVDNKISGYEAKMKQQEKEVQNRAEERIKFLEEEHKKIVADLKKHIQETEKCFHVKELELKRKLDEAVLSNSKISLEKTRLANEKLHLEKEVRKQEALKSDLIRERKEAENCNSALKKEMEKATSTVQQLSKDKKELERRVKDLEAINDELMKRLCASHSRKLHSGDHGSGAISGGESTPTKAMSCASPRSFSSGLDGGSTGPVSLETNASMGDDQNFGPGSLSALSNLILQKGIIRQRSEPSDCMSEDQAMEEYEAVFTQMKKSEMDGRSVWVTTLTEQRSTPSSGNARNLTSPDLGIESDQGRFSSLEASSSAPPEVHRSEAIDIPTRDDIGVKDYKQLEQENIMLKRRLYRTRRALEQTAVQLSEANRRKKEVERAICKQLHKTHHILKQTRVNLDANAEEVEENTK